MAALLHYDGRHYDARIGTYPDDLAFWSRQASNHGDPVLEIACGTGRITIPLAKEGHHIFGLDISESMLARAREKAECARVQITWVRGDCRHFDIGEQFSMIFFPFNSMNHLTTTEDVEMCLASVRKHMTGESRFIMNIFNPRLDILLRDQARRYPHSVYVDPEGGGVIEVTENNTYDRASQINTVHLYFKMPDGCEKREDILCRMFYPQEIDAILKYNGFAIEQKYGDFDESAFESRSPTQIIVTRVGEGP